MAIGATLLTSNYSSTNTSSYATASISPAADSLLLLFTTDTIGAGQTAPMAVPTGLSLTWEQLGTRLHGSNSTNRVGAWIAQCGGSPGSGAITLTENDMGSGTTSSGTAWAVIEITGHHVASPVRQAVFPEYGLTGATSFSFSMSDPVDSNSRPFAYFVIPTSANITERTNWTELSEHTGSLPTMAHQSQWRSDAFETTASATFSSSASLMGIGIEIAEATAADAAPKAYIADRRSTSAIADPVAVNMPNGITAGDLLIAAVSTDAAVTATPGGGEGWTEISAASNASAVRLTVLAKIAVGSDALNLTLGSSNDAAVHVMRIVDHGVSSVLGDIDMGTPATGTSAAPDPPSVTPDANSLNLFIAIAASDDDDHTIQFSPANYTGEGQVPSAASTSSSLVQVAFRHILTGSAEDPGAFALNLSEEWVTQSLCVPPSATATNVGATVVTIPVEIPSAVVESAGAGAPSITISVSIPTVTVLGGADIPAATVTIATDMPVPVLSLDIGLNPVVIPIEIPTPTFMIANTIRPATVTIPVQIPPVTLTATGPENATITPNPVTIKAVIPVPTITGTGTTSSASIYPVPSRIARATGERSLANL